jgi:hypothetical protein
MKMLNQRLPYLSDPLWQKIVTFSIDDPDSALTFTDRLSRENGWSMEFAVRAVGEYKKFMYLLCIADHPLTPSDQVDQVWHLHLIYTRSYWIDWCQQTLNRDIHHGPTKGGASEGEKFFDWYEKTKELYRSTFGIEANTDLWPNGDDRFSDIHFQRINIRQNWIIHKPSIFRP